MPTDTTGWSDHADWTPTTELDNELEQLAAITRDKIETAQRAHVRGPYPDNTRAAIAAIAQRLVDAGLPRSLAEHGVTSWMGLKTYSVAESVRFTARIVFNDLPPVPRLMQGPG